ncbi:CotD family spore coat protein [Peribacillus asahii]|uniref:CotD family spore coat protein n=1 Tax=Peribacillus asahii TaxID=228899 RepID=UPI00257BD76A|nr:CotD family spore coat protein [Peribacillus asahii]
MFNRNSGGFKPFPGKMPMNVAGAAMGGAPYCPPTNVSPAQFGPMPTNVSPAQFGPMPTNVSPAQFGPMPSQVSPAQFGPMPPQTLPTQVAPAQVSPTQQVVKTNVMNTVVPHVHPTHTTTVNKHVFTHQHYFPQTQSVVNQCFNQQMVCCPPPPCCPPRPFGF